MVIKIDSEIELRQLELRDSIDIFETIDSQRDYLGKWLPFVAFTKDQVLNLRASKETENYSPEIFLRTWKFTAN
ncbi:MULTISPECIES: hypothetical protein [Proteiniphilum]|uniref:hypothetical protein n=1 Tax=Proteiniphilum TaxID=294702 RepID=UPI00037B5C51|nr:MULTISPECIES: hypothetical protein [Proteiniphilum]SFL28140.1 hypothetical protein SAMN05216357_11736 [Porphyromonadaceae bacterium KH3CP3RA]